MCVLFFPRLKSFVAFPRPAFFMFSTLRDRLQEGIQVRESDDRMQQAVRTGERSESEGLQP